MFRQHVIRLGGAAAVLVVIAVSVSAVRAQHHGGHRAVRHGARPNHYSYRLSYTQRNHYQPYYFGAFYGAGSHGAGYYTPSYGAAYSYGNHYSPSYGHGNYSRNHYSPHLSLRFGH